MVAIFPPVALAVEVTGQAWLVVWSLGQENKRNCLVCLPEAGKSTLCNPFNHVWALKLVADPQHPK